VDAPATDHETAGNAPSLPLLAPPLALPPQLNAGYHHHRAVIPLALTTSKKQQM
jgi:hypothetical protein